MIPNHPATVVARRGGTQNGMMVRKWVVQDLNRPHSRHITFRSGYDLLLR